MVNLWPLNFRVVWKKMLIPLKHARVLTLLLIFLEYYEVAK